MLRLSPLAARISILVVLFSVEALAATLFLDGAAPVPQGAWLAAAIHTWGASAARFGIAFSALFATFAFLRYHSELKSLSSAPSGQIRWSLLAAHFAAIGWFALASFVVYGDRFPVRTPNLVSALWICAAAAAVILAALAFLPWIFWSQLLRITGWLWAFAAAAAAFTCVAATTFRTLWEPASRVTFRIVQLFLTPFVRDMVLQPGLRRIGTHRFTVVIANECSGLEGIGLLLVFGLMWLVLFRNESRFPQALVLLPLGICALFLLNAARITALILIGNAGAREIAAGGFHSQAGWIAFNSVAFGSSIVARRWSWISTRTHSPTAADPIEEEADSTAALLVPFLSILAAGMISRASSGAFEWLYPIRFFAALAALFLFRKSYARLDWNWSILAPATGLVVLLVWIAADRLSGAYASMPAALATASAWIRYGWIVLRILGAVLTVPIAEELAFRGFLLRRLTGAHVDSIPFPATTWLAVLLSSLLFGLMHGGHFLVAALAGAMYALLLRRTGRIGDAVVAHAVTNALLAGIVLFFGKWQFW
jgi:exosortase E/protease (VPEID-CTERM system)